LLFCHGLKNDLGIFAFIAYECSIRHRRKINLEAEKWPWQATVLANSNWAQKMGGPPCPIGSASNVAYIDIILNIL